MKYGENKLNKKADPLLKRKEVKYEMKHSSVRD